MIISVWIVFVVLLLKTPVPIIKYDVKSATASTVEPAAIKKARRFLRNFLYISASASRHIIAASAYSQNRMLSPSTPISNVSSSPVSLSIKWGISPISRVAPRVIPDDQISARVQFARSFSTALTVASTKISTSI